MITYIRGDLFKSPAQTLVNTVNTVGVMGKGVAKEFKRLYPEMFKEYQELCENDELSIGTLHLYKSRSKWVLNFPTKMHWRNPSKPEYIKAGLNKFVRIYDLLGIHSIAFPPLGCGNGGLDFESVVKHIMESYLQNIPIDVFIYPDRDDPYEPEHTTPKKMKEWLRSEPESLSFKEVWEDLHEVLLNKQVFKTISGRSHFSAKIIETKDEKKISISSSDKIYNLGYDELQNIWSKLRSYGLLLRDNTSAELSRQLSYIIPILSELPYLKKVELTNSYHKYITKHTSTGLQLLAYMQEVKQHKSKQLSLELS